MSEPLAASSIAGPHRRRRLPGLDPRAILGIVLVLCSVAGVLAVLWLGGRATSVYRATVDLPVGEPIDPASLELVEVELGAAADAYLLAGGLPADGAVATRPISAGELVPLAALGASDTDHATVLVPVEGSLPQSATPGAAVELWASAPARGGGHEAPVVLVDEARVLRINAEEGVIAGLGGSQIELRVPRSDVAAVLGAVGSGAMLSIVPVYAGLG